MLVALALWRPWSGEDELLDVRLGLSIELVEPKDEVGEYGTFRWEVRRPPSGWVQVTVYDRATGGEVVQSAKLETNEWTPDTANWPDAIRWELLVDDGSGGQTVSSPQLAWLSGR